MNITDYIGLRPAEELFAEIKDRTDRWNTAVTRNGLINTWQRNYRLYYNADPYFKSGSYWTDFGVTGEHGEYLSTRINHYRNLLTHMLNMIFSKMPAMKSRAANTSPDALESVDLMDAILEYVFQTKRVNRVLKKAGELGLLMGTGAVLCEWDANKGDPYITDENGNLVTGGDLIFKAKSPLDFYVDTSKEEWDNVEWIIVRDLTNKYVLCAQFPDKAEAILSAAEHSYINRGVYFFDPSETDDIPVYKFYHKNINGLLPKGRYMMCVDDGVILYDGPNPYGEIPFFLIKPSDGIGTFYGYSPSFDLAPIQMFYNMVMSSISTNIAAHAVPNIVSQRGSDMSVNQLVGGMNLIEVAPGMPPPQALNLLSTSPEVYQMSQMLERVMETVSGVNSVARGNPDSSLKSGVALGLVQSMAVQFMSGFQQSVINTAEDLGNYALRLYKMYASTPRVVSIVGANKINEIRKWTNADISLVESIYVEPIDPFSQTLAGREARADGLLQKGLVNPQEYLTVATTGQLEPLYKRPLSELNYIRQENQKLMNGEYVEVMETDNHPLHKDEHLTQTFDCDFRSKAQMQGSKEEHIMANLLEHIAKHNNFLMHAQMNAQPPAQGEMPAQVAQQTQQDQQMKAQDQLPGG